MKCGLRRCFSCVFLLSSHTLCNILFGNYSPSPSLTLAWLFACFTPFLIIYNTRWGSWPHLASSDADGLHNDVPIIYHLYISLPSFYRSYMAYVFFCGSFLQSLVSLSLCAPVVSFVIVRYVHSLPRTWTGLDWTLPHRIRNGTVSCYKTRAC